VAKTASSAQTGGAAMGGRMGVKDHGHGRRGKDGVIRPRPDELGLGLQGLGLQLGGHGGGSVSEQTHSPRLNSHGLGSLTDPNQIFNASPSSWAHQGGIGISMSVGGGLGNLKRGVFYHAVVDLDEVDDVSHGVHYHGNDWERLNAHNNDEESGHNVNIGLGLNGQNYYH
jgi:hypothetical protein